MVAVWVAMSCYLNFLTIEKLVLFSIYPTLENYWSDNCLPSGPTAMPIKENIHPGFLCKEIKYLYVFY